jgi:uncharacterized membrane protein
LSTSIPVSNAGVAVVVHRTSLHPLHAFLLGGAECFLVSGLLSDWAFYSSREIQWKNFADWLIIGGLVLAGFAMLWALIDIFRARSDRGRHVLLSVLLLAAWICGFVNELVHAKDAWASLPEALILSVITAVLATVATVLAFSTNRSGAR